MFMFTAHSSDDYAKLIKIKTKLMDYNDLLRKHPEQGNECVIVKAQIDSFNNTRHLLVTLDTKDHLDKAISIIEGIIFEISEVFTSQTFATENSFWLGTGPETPDLYAQLGRPGFMMDNTLECHAYIEQLRVAFGVEIEGTRFRIKQRLDGGTELTRTVEIEVDDSNEASDWAVNVENNLPDEWTGYGLARRAYWREILVSSGSYD